MIPGSAAQRRGRLRDNRKDYGGRLRHGAQQLSGQMGGRDLEGCGCRFYAKNYKFNIIWPNQLHNQTFQNIQHECYKYGQSNLQKTTSLKNFMVKKKKASRITQSQESTVNIEFQVSGPDLSIQAGMCITQNEIYITPFWNTMAALLLPVIFLVYQAFFKNLINSVPFKLVLSQHPMISRL